VPGSIDSSGSRGTHKLIKQGAKLIENTDDILEEILPQIERTTPLQTPSVSPFPEINEERFKSSSAVEQKILSLMSPKRIHIDDLISFSGLTSGDVLRTVTTLELKGMIQQYPGKFFTIKK